MNSYDYGRLPQQLLQDIATQLPGEYELLDFIGEGGHGLVFKALFKPMQQVVALKILKCDFSDDMVERTKRIQSEAKILAKLEHPHIVRVFQMGICKDGTPFMVCEYLEGITLAQYLTTNPNPGPRKLNELFTQLFDALEYSHSKGLIHRDIKPGNIMLLSDAQSGLLRAKILDFGVARDIEVSKSQPLGLTRTIQISGSAPYMSPEQCRGDSVDTRSDIYSLACVLYECLSGKTPFTGETPLHTRYLQIHENPQLPNDELSSLPGRAGLYVLCLKALNKDRERRPQTVAEFKAEFARILSPHLREELWKKKKKSQNKAFTALGLVSIIIASAIVWPVFQNLSSRKSELEESSMTPQTKGSASHKRKAKRGSPIVRIGSIRKTIQSWGLQSLDPESRLPEVLEFHQELDELIPQIDRSNRGLLFTSWFLKTWLEEKMHMINEASVSILKAAAFCKTDAGDDTDEAALCYRYYAMLARPRLCDAPPADLEKTTALLKQSIEIRDHADNHLVGHRLEIPTLADPRGDFIVDQSDAEDLLGEIEFQFHHFNESLKYFQSAEKQISSSSSNVFELRPSISGQALALIKLGRTAEANSVIEKYLLRLQSDSSPANSIRAMRNIAYQASNYGAPQIALLATESALQLCSGSRIDNRTAIMNELQESRNKLKTIINRGKTEPKQ